MKKSILCYLQREHEGRYVLDGSRPSPYIHVRRTGFIESVIGTAELLGFDVTVYEDDEDGMLEAVAYLPRSAFSGSGKERFAALFAISDQVAISQADQCLGVYETKIVLRFDPSDCSPKEQKFVGLDEWEFCPFMQ